MTDRLSRLLPVTVATLLIAACGGGGDAPVVASAESPPTVTASLTDATPASAGDLVAVPSTTTQPGRTVDAGAPTALVVSGLSLVSERRIGRTVFEYTYQVTVRNDGTAPASATLRLSGAGAGTTVVDGDTRADAVPAAASATLPDTVTISQDRTRAFDPAALVWQATAVPPI